uniref:Integrase n=1 Tax=Siphoviridae sp. ctMgg26 TaxID=2825462 RepID=A0A8S5PZF2_9CAUD|nr:MAG TPA: integrase [Siphoviridae sp. ctMgg26]
MKNVVAYIRVSTDGQLGEDKFGLDAQRKQIIEYCAKNDMNILKWYSDEGESGAKYRPGFDAIVYGEVNNPPYEAVVVAKSDRVARDINIYFYYQGALLRKNIELISICEDFGQFGVFANMLKAFTLTCAEMERDNINKRTSGGRKIKAARGGYSGGRPPYGYAPQNGKLVIVPEEAEVVRFVIQSKEKGMTYQMICDSLNDAGKTNRSGTKFSISTLQVIIENKPLYQGMYRYGKGSEWVKGVHEPILSE